MKALLVIMLSLQAMQLSKAESESHPTAASKKEFTLNDLPRGSGKSVVFLRNAAEFDLSAITRMPEVAAHQKEKSVFWIFIGDRAVQVTHLRESIPDGKHKGGKFKMMATFDGPSYEFVSGSDAEMNLLNFLRRSYFTLLDAQAGSKQTVLKMEKFQQTTVSLAALAEYFSWTRTDPKPHNEAQDGAGQPATAPESKPKGGDKPQPEADGRSR